MWRKVLKNDFLRPTFSFNHMWFCYINQHTSCFLCLEARNKNLKVKPLFDTTGEIKMNNHLSKPSTSFTGTRVLLLKRTKQLQTGIWRLDTAHTCFALRVLRRWCRKLSFLLLWTAFLMNSVKEQITFELSFQVLFSYLYCPTLETWLPTCKYCFQQTQYCPLNKLE
jgi:hypothetical protein